MRSLSISLKLTAFAAAAVALILTVAISGWLAVQTVGRSVDTLGGQSLPAVTNLMRMRTWQLASITDGKTAMAWDLSAYEDMPDKAAATQEANVFFSDILKDKLVNDLKAQTYFDAYAKLPRTPDEDRNWEALQKSWQVYLVGKAAFDDSLKQLSAETDWRKIGLGLKALGHTDDQLQNFSNQIQKHLDTLTELNLAYAGNAGEAGQHARQRAALLAVLVGGTALLLCALAAWRVTRSITVPLHAAVEVARVVANGDLTNDVVVTTSDETGQLMTALKNMNGNLARIVSDVRNNTETIAIASREIAAGNLDLSSRTEHQANALQATSASLQTLTTTVERNAASARQASALATSASEVAREGGNVVAQVVDTMESISKSARKIVEITSVIDGIAFQTNILALNAAVEAARAGEQGRGFAVVALEVRNLAQRSATAAKEIKALLSDSANEVSIGSDLVAKAGSTMGAIVASVKRVADIINEIASASVEQNVGLEKINVAVKEMDNVTQQNAALVEEAAAASDSLQQLAERLSQGVSVFKLSNNVVVPVEPMVLLAGPRHAI